MRTRVLLLPLVAATVVATAVPVRGQVPSAGAASGVHVE